MFDQRTSLVGVPLVVSLLICFLINDSFAVKSSLPKTYRPPEKEHACHKSSCYPATGNLLIGRENRLQSSSTCGLSRPERFCIVSHLEEKKCFLCDTRVETRDNPQLNHRIGQITYKQSPGTREQSWWQSENGRENVTVQLDLEAEFHFTHLIIVFATFRPAAMLIERSYDFGKTWRVYKYFAHNCAQSFPGVPTQSRNITDVVCDHRYSGVEPSKNGEVIFRVLPPNMNIENPYAAHIQNMLKMTNLRINFTKLHNLGDTLLDDRLEIQEKYYYAISNMVVRGSCSCYGHASKCLPLDGVHNNKLDMVHGRCECTHNTKGLNCEECEDFYNDLPWKPAFGKQSNACKMCNCNNHANSCHFDGAVYENSGRVSGGVCDNCQHNTEGQHCDQCMQFFYRDPQADIQSPNVCIPCDCDLDGSLDDGICDSISDSENGIEAGACHCKPNVHGRRCDTCREGFWNLNQTNPDGCEECTCNILGTHNNSGCNPHTGECTCKRHVRGKDCNQCLEQTYGLSESPDGCALCDCDAGGSLDNHCDVLSGQCKCRNHMTGRRCDTPKQNYFIPPLGELHEAEDAACYEQLGKPCLYAHGEWSYDRRPEWTGTGYVIGTEGTTITINVDDVPQSMIYDVQVKYLSRRPGDWEDANISVIRLDEIDPDGPCRDVYLQAEREVPFRMPERHTSALAIPSVCLERDKHYRFQIVLVQHRHNEPDPKALIYIDSLKLIPRIEATNFFGNTPPGEIRRIQYEYCIDQEYARDHPECDQVDISASTIIHDGASACDCNPTGSVTKKCDVYGGKCQCKPNVDGRQCDRCAPGMYGFGPEGCKQCDCNSLGALDGQCDQLSGQCRCRPNTYGRVCDECQPGYWGFDDCRQCDCNGHATTCDKLTGECHSCQDFTTGAHCDECIEGFYGDPSLGSEVGCRPCYCPGTLASNHTHADNCLWNPHTQDMVCYCQQGYAGARCELCTDNYFGTPEVPGGSCESCECNGNVDLNRVGNCDGRTGECVQCLYNTAGPHCEYCRAGFYGEALEHHCVECECDLLGTNSTERDCNRYTGQCSCLPNVEGKLCDRCSENHWKIASGEGCEPCNCDGIGAVDEQCNEYTGECTCKEGFGGRQCNQCETNFWGDPNVECSPCDCDVYGSASEQCDRINGTCLCNTGMGGEKCEECARGFQGDAPHCEACGECFDNWDLILGKLQAETNNIIQQAKQIKTLGATGAYTKEFDDMEQKLAFIKHLLTNMTVKAQDISELEKQVDDLRAQLNKQLEQVENSENQLEQVYGDINLANAALSELRNRSDNIRSFANDLKANATQLQEANIEGALKLTREAYARFEQLRAIDEESDRVFSTADKQCQRTDALVRQKQADYDRNQENNDIELRGYEAELLTLKEQIPELNEQMCDKRGDPCDTLCGGAGCDHCGGLSCEKGALTKAETALTYVRDVEKKIKSDDGLAEDLIRSLSEVKKSAFESVRNATESFLEADRYLNKTKQTTHEAETLVNELTAAYQDDVASADEIGAIADNTLALKLDLDRNEIKALASEINEKVAELDNVEQIIQNTRTDLERVQQLKELALDAKSRADKVLENAIKVKNALDDADTAQQKANEAISVARDNIALADNDLKQIDGQTGDAQEHTIETAEKVKELNKKLNEIQKIFQRNEVDANSIKHEVDHVSEAANNAHELATKLQKDYRQANSSLTERAQTSETARQRASVLLKRASNLAGDTNSKLKELENLEQQHRTSNQELDGLKSRLDSLNGQMDGYLVQIQTHADHYRQCTSA